MSEFQDIKFESEAEFLAHVIALKNESEDRLQTMADCLSVHNNPHAAEVFQTLAEFLAQTVQQLEANAAGMQLPNIPPWEYLWHCSDDPESLCMDQAHYMMSVKQSLELALFNEQRSLVFFKRVLDDVEHPQIQQLARQQIDLEYEFADFIQQQMALLGEDDYICDDLDPPNMPE